MPVYSPNSLAPLPKGRELMACEWAQCHSTRWEWEQAARGTCKCPAVFVKQTILSWGALKQLSILVLQTLVTGGMQSLIQYWEELPFKQFFFLKKQYSTPSKYREVDLYLIHQTEINVIPRKRDQHFETGGRKFICWALLRGIHICYLSLLSEGDTLHPATSSTSSFSGFSFLWVIT